ncbi:hypothetical protein CQW23_21377 [Capsicum baccatum]|uniref:Uncharacterized protein n=1 Tax=Capsicum baccatum TaxID=33114 RepID=A0A2G2VXT9_CAPBA|nr:hypothetical protein CQW23_21377 [Capsicum baccatum]
MHAADGAQEGGYRFKYSMALSALGSVSRLPRARTLRRRVGGARAECRSTLLVRTPQLLNTFTGRSAVQVSTMILPQRTAHVAAIGIFHRIIQSVGATGGVYKGQGHSQRELMTRAY